MTVILSGLSFTISHMGNKGDCSHNVEEVSQISMRVKELRKEKDMLRESQPQSFELIKELEKHVKSLSEAGIEDKKYIQQLEKELKNCSHEIEYLQDQVDATNAEVIILEERVHVLESQLGDMEKLKEKIIVLEEKLNRSDAEREFLMEELETKELELNRSSLYIEKLEESISSGALESECEIESMKLDMMALEQNYFEAKKVLEESSKEKERLNNLIEELEVHIQDAQGTIDSLERQNKELRKTSDLSDYNVRAFCQKIKESFEEVLDDNVNKELNAQLFQDEVSHRLPIGKDILEIFTPLLFKLSKLFSPQNMKEKMQNMSEEIHEYELLVKKLKEEVKENKLKAKEEAEDLAQEMAELRYQISGLLDDECKRRACIEQASLRRIAELEAQVERERRKSCPGVLELE